MCQNSPEEILPEELSKFSSYVFLYFFFGMGVRSLEFVHHVRHVVGKQKVQLSYMIEFKQLRRFEC
jgi:hypothetical protein